MASQEYQRGQMDISGQRATWGGFMLGATWGCLILTLVVGYSVLTLAIGINWIVSLGLMAAVGFGTGMFMNLGGRWMATVVVMIILALVVQAFIWLFGVMI